MRRRWVVAALLGSIVRPAFAQDRVSVTTVAGEFRGSCAGGVRSEGTWPGEHSYSLAGRPLPSLGDNCTRGTPTSNASIHQVWRSLASTTLLMTHGQGEEWARILLIHFRAGADPLTVELTGNFAVTARRLSDTAFLLVHHGVDEEDRWDCEYEVDFATQTVSSHVAHASDAQIGDWICGTDVVEAPLGALPDRAN